MNKKISTLMILFLLLPLAVVFSGGEKDAAPKGPVKLVYMTEWEQMTEFNNYFVEKGKEFAALYPNECSGVEVITVPYSGYEAKFLSSFHSNTQVCDFFKGMPHIWAGLYNFADPMPKALADRLNRELVSYLEPIGMYEGVRYGYPVEAGNFQQLYINEDMFREAGLDPAKPPRTFDELLEYAKKLVKYDASGNVTVAGFALRYSGEGQGVADKNLTILHAFGGKMFDPDRKVATGVVNSPESIQGLDWIKKCLDEKVTSLEIGVPETAFGQGRAAMILRESWVSGWLDLNAPDINYRIYPAPAQKVAIGGGNLFPWANMVYSNSPNKELAWKFLDFLLTSENDLEQSKRQGLLPVMAAGYESDYVKNRIDYQSVSEVIKRGPGPAYDYYIPEMNQLASIFGSAIQEVMYGRATSKSALDNAARSMDQVLKN
ncbi:extracellular solute-binding protein [Breznakiella homolactica]|uniref:Extracellular solute-binding protein n=1 Tax=Breznakiella homolactica TaxID=2798577 RepID=A0A7T8B9G7_9SPIR|nr:extracellular solute-binding protein [Breznakiella homolactica]QQO08432.1 extracellular solute-binding protein [Breznakiella homolactica]